MTTTYIPKTTIVKQQIEKLFGKDEIRSDRFEKKIAKALAAAYEAGHKAADGSV